MSHIEIKKRNDSKYFYFVKKFSFLGKQFKINNYIGKDTITTTNSYIQENLDKLVNQEFELKKTLLNQNMTHNPTIIEKIEKKSSLINNLIEAKNPPNFEKKLIEKFVYNSNTIEGSKLPESEIKKIFELKTTNHTNKNEILEAQNSLKAYNYLKEDFSFSMRNIKKLYQTLTKNLIMETGDKYPTGFRRQPIIIGNEPTLDFKEIKESLKNLLKWYKKNKKTYPLKLAFDFHLRYEQIHPFRDGNGRTGRLIMNKILLKNKYPLMLIYNSNKQAYFNAIKKGLRGNKRTYYDFMLNQQLKSYNEIEKFI